MRSPSSGASWRDVATTLGAPLFVRGLGTYERHPVLPSFRMQDRHSKYWLVARLEGLVLNILDGKLFVLPKDLVFCDGARIKERLAVIRGRLKMRRWAQRGLSGSAQSE